MSKYIRTTIGVYELPKGFTTFVWKNKTYLENENHEVLSAWGNIIAQTDNIEELCDDVVVKYQNELPIPQRIKNLKECMKLNHITWEEHFGWLFKRFKEKLEWVKLAIYTDKGLIYVAKMNEKGELELL